VYDQEITASQVKAGSVPSRVRGTSPSLFAIEITRLVR
jgi:hypothetical protein